MLLKVITAALVASGAPIPRNARQATESMCFASPVFEQRTVDVVRHILSAQGEKADTRRDRLGLTEVRDSAVAIIKNDSLCLRAAEAQRALAEDPDQEPLIPVILARVGSRYIVFDGSNAGEFLLYAIYDDDFHYIASVTG